MKSKTIVVTGGTGYIGSHTVVELMGAGYDVVIIDNLDNSKASVIERIGKISGRQPSLVVGDIRDAGLVAKVLKESGAHAVMHFAGVKSVSESCAEPLKYYDTNVVGTIEVLKAMAETDVRGMIFSSSTTVYGNALPPVTEDKLLQPLSPYGRSKAMVETALRDLAAASSRWRFIALRYFNPVGAHDSGLIGEDPTSFATNLMPYVCRVAKGAIKKLTIYGNDYPTEDGTAVRDFIHVVDLAKGHVAALRRLDDPGAENFTAVNLGTGRGTTVFQLVKTFSGATGTAVPFEFAPRREGDVAVSFADVTQAALLLNWRTERDLAAMCRDAWNWQSRSSATEMQLP